MIIVVLYIDEAWLYNLG